MIAVSQTLFLFVRLMRNLFRQPIWIALMLIQPMFWLLLYSQLFRRITDLPGFGTTSYIDYLTPGVAVMTAFFSGSWAGMGMSRTSTVASSSGFSRRRRAVAQSCSAASWSRRSSPRCRRC